ncbi:MAG: zinc ribbon domain-containing protein [Candidatus Margulisbacteria bacterium]|nr:zinc ribbon domain-containing protein [Candidatus Margulisiibacteriota bacterium]
MPLYDYKCTKCNHIFEVKQRITEKPLKECPKCGGKVNRLISAAGIVFKGSGFHVTDYKKKTKSEKKVKESKPKEIKSSAKDSSPTPSK